MAGPWDKYAQDPPPAPWKKYAPQSDLPVPQDEGTWERGVLLPLERNSKTGEYRPAVPQVVEGVMDAVTLPGDVYAGRVDPMSDEGIARSIGFATTFSPGVKLPASKTLPSAKRVLALEAKQAEDKFGIPLTKGQATGDITKLRKEELLRQGSGGAGATVRSFDKGQQEAVASAVEKVGSSVGTGAEKMPDTVAGAVKDRVAFFKEQADALYDIARDGNLVVKREALDKLPGFVQAKLADDGVIVDAGITPVAAQALKEIESAGLLEGALRPAAPKTGVPADEVAGVSLQGIEQIRKRLVGLKGSTPEDIRAVSAIKRTFDEWLDDSVDNLLISGDEKSLEALKKARSTVVEYKRVTAPAPGDQVGLTLKKFLNEETTAQEVANWLYGADIVSPSLNAPKLAARIRNMLGTESEAWKSVKAAAWERVVKDLNTGDPRSVVQMVKRINGFLNNKGSSLARILYTSEERQLMSDLAKHLGKTIMPREATNPSRTAFTLAGMMNTVATIGAAVAGYNLTGSPETALISAVAYPVFKEALKGQSARSAVKGVKIPSPAWISKPAFEAGGNALARGAGAAAGANAPTTEAPPKPTGGIFDPMA